MSTRNRRRAGFTLVELLVVIGIIALLVSILLPALGSAQREAQSIKCAAALKEIGNAMNMYAIDNQSYYPVAQAFVKSGSAYNLYGIDYPSVASNQTNAYWTDFLAKYVTKAKGGGANGAALSNQELARTRRSILWGCPSFQGYASTSAATTDFARAQTGYGMNGFPTFTSSYPTAAPAGPFGGGGAVPNYPPEGNFTYDFTAGWVAGTPDPDPNGNHTKGYFYKQTIFQKQGADRALVCDSRFWLAESLAIPSTGVIPPQPYYQNTVTYTTGITGQTLLDLYRHGKYPGPGTTAGTLSATGGQVAFNILYADGHVKASHDKKDAYLKLRMKFPG